MRRLGPRLGAALLFAGLAFLAGGHRFTRVAVSGHSMEPGLRDADWLLVDRLGPPRVATIVVVRDPTARDRLIVKRVRNVGTDSQLVMEGDHPAHAGELIGPIPARDVVGVALLRYWPPSRVGWVR